MIAITTSSSIKVNAGRETLDRTRLSHLGVSGEASCIVEHEEMSLAVRPTETVNLQ